jgi:hypothetical protein
LLVRDQNNNHKTNIHKRLTLVHLPAQGIQNGHKEKKQGGLGCILKRRGMGGQEDAHAQNIKYECKQRERERERERARVKGKSIPSLPTFSIFVLVHPSFSTHQCTIP